MNDRAVETPSSAAPRMATGPVMMWPPARGIEDAWIAARAGGILNPDSGGGITSGAPDTHSSVTVSPESIVRSAGKPASNWPQRTVSGDGEMW